MKTKSFLSLFVIFTVLTTTTNSQIVFLTANGNNTADTTNTFIFKTGAEYMHWVNTGDVPAGVVAKPGVTAAQLAEQSKQGAIQAKKCLVNNIVHSNNITKQFGPAITTQAELDKAFKGFEATLFVALVDFKGKSINEMQLTHDTVTNAWGNNYSSTGHHASVGILPCLISRQTDKNGKVHEFIIADARCGQPFGSKSTMMALENNAATIVATGATPTPPSNQQGTAANNGNVNLSGGNGNVSIPNTAGTAGTINITVIAGNGNGNGSSNGGQGGNATGGTATANNALPTSGAATGAATGTTGGFNFGTFIPGSGVTTTTTAPGGAATTSATTTTTNVATGPDYTKPLRAIAGGTYVGPILGALTAYGLSWIPRPAGSGTTGGSTTVVPGSGGGVVRNPG